MIRELLEQGHTPGEVMHMLVARGVSPEAAAQIVGMETGEFDETGVISEETSLDKVFDEPLDE